MPLFRLCVTWWAMQPNLAMECKTQMQREASEEMLAKAFQNTVWECEKGAQGSARLRRILPV